MKVSAPVKRMVDQDVRRPEADVIVHWAVAQPEQAA
jgi:hypothetical protein